MFANFTISKIRNFVNRERIYFLMLSFIFLVNAWFIFAARAPLLEKGIVRKGSFAVKPSNESSLKYTLGAYEDVDWREVIEKNSSLRLLTNILGLGVMFVFALGLFLDVRILSAKIKKRPVLRQQSGHLPAKWKIWDIFRLGIIFVFLGYCLHIVEAGILFSTAELSSGLYFMPLLNTGVLDLLILGLIVYFVKVKYKQGIAALGLKLKNIGKNIFLGAAGYIAFLTVLTGLLLLLFLLAALFNYQPPPQTIFKLFLEEQRLWLLLYSWFVVVILGPIAEEIFFRGFAYNALKKKMGTPRAMLLTAAVFAGLHANLLGFLPILALGLLLVYMYERTGSLVSSITVHVLHNAIMIFLLLLSRYYLYLAEGS